VVMEIRDPFPASASELAVPGERSEPAIPGERSEPAIPANAVSGHSRERSERPFPRT
jgi:hypothetical protein